MLEKLIVLKKTNGKECIINVADALTSVEEKGNGVLQIRTEAICIDVEMSMATFMAVLNKVQQALDAKNQPKFEVKGPSAIKNPTEHN